MTTDQNLSAARTLVLVLDILQEIIKGAGTAGIPSGHLYAQLMGKMSLEQYTKFIDILKDAGKVTENGHVLRYVNPVLIDTAS